MPPARTCRLAISQKLAVDLQGENQEIRASLSPFSYANTVDRPEAEKRNFARRYLLYQHRRLWQKSKKSNSRG